MPAQNTIRRAQSLAAEAREAVREFHTGVVQPDMALVVFFCSSDYDLDALADEMRQLFPGIEVVGCTTAGEIGPAGYCEHSLSGASFGSSQFRAVSGLISHLQQFRIGAGQSLTLQLMQRMAHKVPLSMMDSSFALLLIDGLSVREEPVTRAMQSTLGKIPLIGGSAGDGANFRRTCVFSEGRFHADSAVLTLVTTTLPFRLLKTHNFEPTEERLVVTAADPTRRLVKEINGRTAASEYARAIGVDVHTLNLSHFACWSMVVLINGTTHVRSIQQANADGSLTFFCAIENGLVLRVAKGVDLLGNLDQAFAQVRNQIGVPQLVLGGDCLHRKLEAEWNNEKEQVADILKANNTTGFATYGEQFRGIHVNQTFVAVAIGTENKAGGPHGHAG